jgi:hypothetical protein
VLAMFNEDNSGFINFPMEHPKIASIDSGKTLVYIVVYDPYKRKVRDSKMENINLFSPGVFVSDDVIARPPIHTDEGSLDELIDAHKEQNTYDSMYFPNFSSDVEWKRQMSINLVSSICVGWSNYSFEFRNDIRFWNATFKDLTNEGKNLYYSIKKLHNNKEVRILTFSTN